MSAVNRERIAAGWNARGFSCGVWVDAPGQRWEDYIHETDELVMVVEGEMEYEVEGRVLHPKLGEEFLIPAGVVHSARNIGSGTARWLYGYRRR
jgi:quercetin dioxygenase-like cupin family protein